jgi:hypothetical protein
VKDNQEELSSLDPQRGAEVETKLASVAQIDETLHPQPFDEPLHELQMYQEELAVQDEELRRSQEAIESMCAHFIELYDFAPVGYLTLSENGFIDEINLIGAKLQVFQALHVARFGLEYPSILNLYRRVNSIEKRDQVMLRYLHFT